MWLGLWHTQQNEGHLVSQVRLSTCLFLNLYNFPYRKHLCSRIPTNSGHQTPVLIVIIYLISLTLTLSTHHPPATSGTSDPHRSCHPHFWPRQSWYILLPPPKSVKLPAISWSRSFPLTVWIKLSYAGLASLFLSQLCLIVELSPQIIALSDTYTIFVLELYTVRPL